MKFQLVLQSMQNEISFIHVPASCKNASHENGVLPLQCGLDRSKRAEEMDIEEQAAVMTEQVKLAKELQRPVSVSLKL